jgi:hypothetical protein
MTITITYRRITNNVCRIYFNKDGHVTMLQLVFQLKQLKEQILKTAAALDAYIYPTKFGILGRL